MISSKTWNLHINQTPNNNRDCATKCPGYTTRPSTKRPSTFWSLSWAISRIRKMTLANRSCKKKDNNIISLLSASGTAIFGWKIMNRLPSTTRIADLLNSRDNGHSAWTILALASPLKGLTSKLWKLTTKLSNSTVKFQRKMCPVCWITSRWSISSARCTRQQLSTSNNPLSKERQNRQTTKQCSTTPILT